jgi:uncharacterized protein (DUF2147 family)
MKKSGSDYGNSSGTCHHRSKQGVQRKRQFAYDCGTLEVTCRPISNPRTRFRIQVPVAVFISILVSANLSLAADMASAVGFWKNEDATFELFENQGKLSGKIIALKEPLTPEGKDKTDIHNPDASKRERPIIGLVFMSGFSKKSDTRWENGSIYDPKSGSTYSCFLELDGSEKIKVRGFIGISLIGRTDIWTRVRGNDRS